MMSVISEEASLDKNMFSARIHSPSVSADILSQAQTCKRLRTATLKNQGSLLASMAA